MGIVTEKNVITQEELKELQEHLNQSQTLTLELGARYETAKKTLVELTKKEQEINKAITDKYGKISLDYKTGEYTKLD